MSRLDTDRAGTVNVPAYSMARDISVYMGITELELKYQRTSRITLMNELLTCYQYLKEHDMLLLYEAYRNGDEVTL